MNKIDKLMMKAGLTANEEGLVRGRSAVIRNLEDEDDIPFINSHRHPTTTELEYFANLIVQECVNRIKLHARKDEVTEDWVYNNLESDLTDWFDLS